MSCREQAGIRARLWPNPSVARFAGRPGVLHEPAGQLVAVFIAIVLRWRWRMLSRCSRAGGCADAPSQRLEDRVAAGSRVERRCTALCEPVSGQRPGKRARGWMLAGACGRVLPGMAVAELAPAAPSCLHPSIPDGIVARWAWVLRSASARGKWPLWRDAIWWCRRLPAESERSDFTSCGDVQAPVAHSAGRRRPGDPSPSCAVLPDPGLGLEAGPR